MLHNFAKYATAAFYVVGGPLIHFYMVTQHRELYAAIADQAGPIYQSLWNNLVLPNLVPLVILLVGFEIVAGLLMFSKDSRLASLGHLAGLIFNLLLVPFWFAYGIPNLLLCALHFWLLRWEQGSHPSHLQPAH